MPVEVYEQWKPNMRGTVITRRYRAYVIASLCVETCQFIVRDIQKKITITEGYKKTLPKAQMHCTRAARAHIRLHYLRG